MATSQQLTLDFSRVRAVHEDGKKDRRIPTAASQELKELVEIMARKQGISVSELTHRYIVEGLRSDLMQIFLPEPHLDKSLREVLGKF
jgi:hypothetical protein